MPSTKCPLYYHKSPQPGKIMIRPSKPINNLNDLELAYTPGVAKVCRAIADNPLNASQYTSRHQTVAVISNGTAVLGLGDIGPLASKPVMEGKSALFYRFGGVQSIDIEIDEKDPKKLIDIIKSLEPSFGAINLEDIKAPDCFMIEEELSKKMDIPVFHDDQHGTAVVVAAALINALYLKKKNIEQAKCVVLGAGSASIACLNLLVSFGLHKDNIFLFDSNGIVHCDRPDLTPEKKDYARKTSVSTLKQALNGADILIGLARPNLIAEDDICHMAEQPIIFPLSNPDPEISPESIRRIHPNAFIGTGQSCRPNQINNLLCFPYIFRGCMDTGAKHISNDIKKSCVQALVHIARKGFSDSQGIYEKSNQNFGPEYLIPYAFDPMLRIEVSKAVAQQALKECPSNQPFSMDDYHQKLARESYRDQPIIGALISRLPFEKRRLWYVVEGDDLPCNILDAAQYMERYGLASVGLVTTHPDVQRKFQSNDILSGVPIIDEIPSENHVLCVRTGQNMPSSTTLSAFDCGNYTVVQSYHRPRQSVQNILSDLNYNIPWEQYTEKTHMLQSPSCLFIRTQKNTLSKNIIGPLRIDDHIGTQWVDPKEQSAHVIEKSCFIILESFLA